MTGEEIPEGVERLLFEKLDSYEQLEALLLLFADPQQPLSTAEVASKLGISQDAALEALDHLRERELIAATAAGGELRFRYGTPPADLDGTVRSLARIYREKPVEIAKRMTANAIERVRTAAIRTFSDAFLLRKDKRGDG